MTTGQEIPDASGGPLAVTGASSGIDAKSRAYMAMSDYFQLADDLLGGTMAMRKAGARWLPQFPGEEAAAYQWRLKNAVLRNLLAKSADMIVGQMFKEEIDTSELKLDKEIEENFDLRGSSIHQYAAKVARKMLTHGMVHTFTDLPRDDRERTLADEKQFGIRPYAIMINPTDLWFALPKVIRGVEVPIDARWAIESVQADGLGDMTINEIRRLRIIQDAQETLKVGQTQLNFAKGAVIFEVWRTTNRDSSGYGLVEAGELKGIDYIPLRTAYSDYQSFMMSIPVLDGVAHKNREHWQASSDHNSIVQMSRFPMFYATGVSEEEMKSLNILGPHIKLTSTNEQAQFGYVETTGSAVDQSFKDLERIAREADQESIESLYKAGSDTATGRTIDLMESMSPAQIVAKETERHINEVLQDFKKRLNGREVGKIKIDLNFGFGKNEQMLITALNAARATGDIPRTYYLKRLQEFNVIGDDVKPEELAAEADNEQAARGLTSQFGNDTGQNGPGAVNPNDLLPQDQPALKDAPGNNSQAA